MKLSVVIPAYNEEKLIVGCLEKVHAALEANRAADWSPEVIRTREIFAHCFRSLLSHRGTLGDPKKLDYFYDGRR